MRDGHRAREILDRACYDRSRARTPLGYGAAERVIEPVDGLLMRLCEGDRRALLQVTRMVTHRLARLGAYDLRDDWSDISQEIVLSLIKAARAGKAPSEEKLGAYIARAAWNRFAGHLRQTRLDGVRTIDDRADVDAAVNGDEPLAPERVAARQAFARLPQPMQELLWARYLEGLSVDTIVARSGRSRASVNRDLAKARAQFRALLGLANAPNESAPMAPAAANDDTMQDGRDEADRS